MVINIVTTKVKKSKLEISKTRGGYYRVYKVVGNVAKPYSPKEFLNKADARKWIASKKKPTKRKTKK